MAAAITRNDIRIHPLSVIAPVIARRAHVWRGEPSWNEFEEEVESRSRYEIISKRAWLLLNCGRSCLTRCIVFENIKNGGRYVPRSPRRIENARFVSQAFLIAKLMLFQRFPCNRYDEAARCVEKRVLSIGSKIFLIAVNLKIVYIYIYFFSWKQRVRSNGKI